MNIQCLVSNYICILPKARIKYTKPFEKHAEIRGHYFSSLQIQTEAYIVIRP